MTLPDALILAPLRPGVRRVIDLAEVAGIQVRVDLGGGEVGVAEEFLHRSQIAAGLQQVRRRGMPQPMGVHSGVDAGCHGPPVQALLYGTHA